MDTLELEMTMHSNVRIQQRGIKGEVVNLVLQEADQINECRNGSHSLFISKKKLKKLACRKTFSTQIVDKAKGVVLVIADDTVITVFHKKRRLRLN